MLSDVKSTLPSDRPLIMGVLNITPDSFSDGGCFFDRSRAVERALEMVEEGADIVDVGGESTRPGSEGVSLEQELERVVPVIGEIASRTTVRISVDTTRARVAAEAISAGAGVVNDVSMLRGDEGFAAEVAGAGADLVIMHSRKTPRDMQEEIRYGDVVNDVRDELMAAVERAVGGGVGKDRIWIDPGIGFAKTAGQNLELMARLEELVALGYPVLVGPSRKSFIGAYTGAPVDRREGGTAAAVALSVANGARAVRVHDVAVMRQAAIIAHEISRAVRGGEGA